MTPPDLRRAVDMTLEDWFATHAPEVPKWFACDAPDMPPLLPIDQALEQQPGYVDLADTDKRHLRDWLTHGTYDIEEHLADIGNAAEEALIASRQAREDMQAEHEAERYFAWRWHYAALMLKGPR